MAYINILRPLNLLLIALMMCLVKFGFLSKTNLLMALDDFAFITLLIATICITAAGNIINDIYDQAIDAINKPTKRIVGVGLTEKAAYNYYMALNVLGVLLGLYVANQVGKPSFALVFIMTSALLYWYASHLKKVLLAGNLLISFLVGFTVVLFIIFDLVPSFGHSANREQVMVSNVLLLYAVFAFVVNLIREIVKDIIDINGDRNGEVKSMPIIIGRKRATNLVFALSILFLGLLLFLMYNIWYNYSSMTLYFLLAVIAPLLLFIVKTYSAKKPKDYLLLSLLLKLILFTGIGSIIFYPEILSHSL